MSGPRPDNGRDVASHSLADPHMHDKVDMEEFLGPHSDRHKEMLSLDSESEVKYDLTISIVIYFLILVSIFFL